MNSACDRLGGEAGVAPLAKPCSAGCSKSGEAERLARHCINRERQLGQREERDREGEKNHPRQAWDGEGCHGQTIDTLGA